MRNLIYISILGFLLLSCTSEGEKSKTSDQNNKQPNILLVVVDDMGWTDTEPYGGEISTPRK